MEKLNPITTRMNELMQDTGEIDKILADGSQKAAEIAEPILKQTYEIVGYVAGT